jgi:hypothetical protein
MEENQPTQTANPSNYQPSGNVSFPSVGESKKSGGPKMLLIFGILILIGVLGFVIFKSANTKSETPEPTPFDNLTAPIQEPTPFPSSVASASPSATAKPADKESVKIQALNGTGIAGEAAYLQTQLKGLGYTDVKTGNASVSNATTTDVTFSKTLSATIVDEITQKLKALYQTVNVKTATSPSFDVDIVIGSRKGATPRASGTPAATGTPRASGSPSPSPSPSATP